MTEQDLIRHLTLLRRARACVNRMPVPASDEFWNRALDDLDSAVKQAVGWLDGAREESSWRLTDRLVAGLDGIERPPWLAPDGDVVMADTNLKEDGDA